MLAFIMFDIRYFIVVGPFILLSLLASMYVKGSFKRWSKFALKRRMTGAHIAAEVLHGAGIGDVRIEQSQGFLSDHYDPTDRVVRLSPDVYQSESIAACAVAAHEVGHAIQHAEKYAPLALRSAAVPAASFGSNFGVIIVIAGILLAFQPLVWIGIVFFSAVVLFQLITLPVEFDASRRAKAVLIDSGLIDDEEARGVSSVLNAAAMTYVAAALTSIATLIYYLGFLRSDE